MRRLRRPLGTVLLTVALLALGLPNASVAQADPVQTVSGRAVDANANPIGNLTVQLFEPGADPAQAAPSSSGETDEFGRFSIDAEVGEINTIYDLVLGWGDNDYVPVTRRVTVLAGEDLDVPDLALHRVYATGRVVDATGQPAAGVRVSSLIWRGGSWQDFSGDDSPVTDVDGVYRVKLRPMTGYTLFFEVPGASSIYLGGTPTVPPREDPFATRPGVAEDDQVPDVALPATGRVTVRLVTRYAETVTGAYVALYVADHQPGDDVQYSLEEGEAGSYQSINLPVGEYDLVVTGDIDALAVSSPRVKTYTRKISLDDDLDLGAIVLELADPSVSGTVYDRYGSPLAGATATRRSSDTKEGTPADDGPKLVTDATGGFGWGVTHNWNWVIIAASCGSVTSPPADAGLDSVTGRGIRLGCGTAPVTKAVSISGSPSVGATLTAVSATVPADFAPVGYQWLRDGEVIANENGVTYAVTDADRGHQVTVRQTFRHGPVTDFAGESLSFDPVTSESAPVTAPLAEFSAPNPWLEGAATLDSTLTANPGTWPEGTTLTWQWNRDGIPVAGRTGSTYVITLEDLGQPITVTLTASRDHYSPATRTSAALTPDRLNLAATPTPKVSGKAKAGSRLTAKVGTWGPVPVSLTYEWLRSGTPIPGATRTTYKVQRADGGSKITFRVTGTKTGYASVAKMSAAGKRVPLSKLKTAKPRISGKAKVGSTLSANPGRWTTGVTATYKWYRSGRAVQGVTGSTYTLTAADAGKVLKVKVTGSKQGYRTVVKTSRPTKKVR